MSADVKAFLTAVLGDPADGSHWQVASGSRPDTHVEVWLNNATGAASNPIDVRWASALRNFALICEPQHNRN